MIMFALEEEMNNPLRGRDGPVGLILCPSRELARQTYEVVEYYLKALYDAGYPELRSALCIGGESNNAALESANKYGIHCVVATPGRLNDLLNKGKLNMNICKYLVLDEADRMLDLGFDEEVHNIINKFKRQRQTALFSATMPQKFQDFAKNTLIQPLLVNVGRAGAANLDVIQEVEYVKKEAKIVYLLECLQKTAPPVIIFCERKNDVDEIHEYLLIKGVMYHICSLFNHFFKFLLVYITMLFP
jgi:ATP-dependent RNA helicase DDX41